MQYQTSGTCSKAINVEVDDNGVITSLSFVGGCNGNLQGLSAMAIGMKAEDVIARLRGINCGNKSTSCPDQLANALEQILEK